ncbi:MEKHLA domain-containing protein [Pseudonocardia xinjiangensis]|uniref:MEKHLA domain-containing protein n=1 Tax=Pseudonocardia xinjiangensis TaxID=75289 RepID=UPI003D8FC2BF
MVDEQGREIGATVPGLGRGNRCLRSAVLVGVDSTLGPVPGDSGSRLPSSAEDPDFFRLLVDSHQRFVGAPLVDPAATARWLYEDAPFGLLAHDADADPRFVYANRTAQRCFEYGWDEFTGLRSRLSAEPDRQEDRNRLLAEVREHQFSTGYRGLRIARSGRRFWIEDVTMWNLVSVGGVRIGQAAVFYRYSDASTTRPEVGRTAF